MNDESRTPTHTYRALRRLAARQWSVPVAAVLLVGVMLVVARLAPSIATRTLHSSTRPELRDLMASLEAQPTRPVKGRLTGGWSYAPSRPLARGAGERHAPPDVLIAAANIQKAAAADDSPTNRAALGVAHLVIGDVDRAVEALQEAVQRDDGNARFLSDLAAALMARAETGANGEDWAAALDAAARAIKLDPAQVEAHFNRALALEGLRLTDQAIDARVAYHRVEAGGKWVDESVQQLQELRQSLDASSQPRRPVDHQLLRERIEDDLLPTWARAVLSGQADIAGKALEDARRQATELADAGGDTMALDEVHRIARAGSQANDAVLRDLAAGHVLFGDARQEYVRDNQQRAAELMTKAAGGFRRAASPYAAWAPVYRSIWLRNQGEAQRALDEASRVDVASLPASYHHLRGRVAWSSAVAFSALGQFDLTLERIKQAVAEYGTAREVDNLIAAKTILAEAEWFLGDTSSAWSNLVGVLESVADQRGSRRDYHLWLGAAMAVNDGLVHAASAFDNARVAVARSARSQAEAYLNRARTRVLAGNHLGAMEDLDRAEHAVFGLSDQALRERNVTDIRIARATVLSETDCHASLASANAAMQSVPKTDPALRLADLLALRAKCRQMLGDVQGARADLFAAIDAFERKRSSLRSIHDRTQAFERERQVFKRLIEIEADQPDGSNRALAIAERARAGALLETWTRSEEANVDLSAARRELPNGTAIVYYETLPTKTLVWSVSRERVTFFTRPIGTASLEQTVARITRRVRDGASLEALAPDTRDLFDVLIRPALEAAGHAPTIFFVPDGPLHALPFGAIPDDVGRPLLATRNVGTTPGLTGFLAASRRLAGFSPDNVLAVGDGHDPKSTGLPLLRWADVEAARVGSLYPQQTVLTKGLATKARLIRSDADVFHFSGHTIANERFPTSSRLLLAPEDSTSDSGAWVASEIVEHRFRNTRPVVLSTCDSAAGKFVAGEGVLSVGRAFFAAGVPSVIASLWPVDDDVVDFMVSFHRELRSRNDAVGALRAVQLALLESAGPHVPVRRWGGFVAYGGAIPMPSSHVAQFTR